MNPKELAERLRLIARLMETPAFVLVVPGMVGDAPYMRQAADLLATLELESRAIEAGWRRYVTPWVVEGAGDG